MTHRFDDNQPNGSTREGGLDCPSFETLSAYFDTELDSAERAAVDIHVTSCSSCQRILDELSLLRSGLKISSPAVGTRSFAITGADSVQQIGNVTNLTRKTRSFPFFPVAAAIAAILLLALIAGERFSEQDGPPATEAAESQVLIIDGTPFTDDGDDAQFGAASSGSMNESAGDASTSEQTGSEQSFWSDWRIAQGFALLAGLAAVGIWIARRFSVSQD